MLRDSRPEGAKGRAENGLIEVVSLMNAEGLRMIVLPRQVFWDKQFPGTRPRWVGTSILSPESPESGRVEKP